MPQQSSSVENNFIGGLKTEFTGLNFPENACTDADNVIFTTIGDVLRRRGIDLEENYTTATLTRLDNAISTFKWENVGGDGSTKILVTQTGNKLWFWKYSAATVANPISYQILGTQIDMTSFITTSASITQTYECQYAEGNGYLFVFHPYMNPFYVSYSSGTITATQISIRVRDFNGVPEPGVDVSLRPGTLTDIHKYNIVNQGWNSAAPWVGNSTDTVSIGPGSKAFNIASGLTIPNGTPVRIFSQSGAGVANAPSDGLYMSGTVTSYVGTLLTVNVTYYNPTFFGTSFSSWIITPSASGFIDTWQTAIGNYPSNADVWWKFKNSSDVFAPATTAANVTLNSGRAPGGHFILDAFNQTRTAISGVANITDITTTSRPKTGAWFQGRVWYAGVDGSTAASGTAPFYTWTETVYFSQTAVNSDQFGMAFQVNDPTAEDFFDELSTDGGEIKIQGCGSIYKLFPIQYGLLVFAANGVWLITGSQGIGFAANDYTVNKISAIKTLTGTSFVNVQGLPFFWNEEGIYMVQPAQNGPGGRDNMLNVENIVVGTISSFYETIPLSSKMYARGDYDPLSYVISWVYRDTEAADVQGRYEFNRQLNLNTHNKAFYTYTIEATTPILHDIKFIHGVSGANAPAPAFKYLCTTELDKMTFAEEYDSENWVDFSGGEPTNYISYFVTGYKLHGKAIVKWQPLYLNFFSRADRATSYKIQGIWDYANDPNSGKYSNIQLVTNGLGRFGMIYRKHKIRGRGLSLQLKVTSVDRMPFDIMGWSSQETLNTGM